MKTFNQLSEAQKETINAVVNKAAQLTGESPEMFMTTTRKREYVFLRMAIIKALANNGWTSQDIGAGLGKDRTTIIHARISYDKVKYMDSIGNEDYRGILELTESLTRFISDGVVKPSPLSLSIVAKHMTRQGSSIYSVIGLIH
jgi:hypothetical protein